MKGKRHGIEVSIALADAVKLCDADVIAAYPITPQTHIVEHLAELVAEGELDAEYIPVESEHSALSACLGSAAAGARTFTATAGQGLELMHEVLYVASGMRLPIVMAVANRALSAPLSVWGDHSDAMAVRDTGWIQIFTENGQEVVDQIICAFKIAEHHKVLLPVMVHLDGFNLSHVIEPIEMPDQQDVCSFAPHNRSPLTLHPNHPVAMGDFAPPVVFTEAKWAQEQAMLSVKPTIIEVWDEFARKFGRPYKPVECYKCDGAKNLLFTMGSFSETAMTAVDKLRQAGVDIGLVRLRLWRPFPFEEFRAAVKDAETLLVLDRCISSGGPGGPVASELKSALYNLDKKPKVVSFVGGLGGRDITVAGFEKIIVDGLELAEKGQERIFEIVGVRE
ncbi:transketolase C-terminal domain-containing protein [Dehalogenimonas alkenigignens]|uniref:Pyruvate:ferredoxin oxidoreductase or related 2-oxoacid:ferredoxin oxidoreductase, alpha subunit n=1 Tax=Dehalogenimonas alkenigignens TaxID=1217799 RepID=A0A0W0GIW2_9CHLR|nr:transketolase C-terminal domain-containing protein [Dehalogenimonas alkenigignens]KTB48503.1 Pyruvate:ferredoxin oxidoreductase or related 2-oxoacid:ferredoxin oxidoreductase, alpha subunit [Dehalogenimonas alkenigignens]PVV85049.1 pyruvate ferredoxin oxidoreductase [Dehalogenimonas alkenigignens]